MIAIPSLLAVAAGGAIGASARYVVGAAALRALGPAFPWGTLIVNVAGGFAMGLIAVALMEKTAGGFARYGPFLLTGVLGGFTTFSAFSLDILLLVERGAALRAGLYAAASVSLSVGALWLGAMLARAL